MHKHSRTYLMVISEKRVFRLHQPKKTHTHTLANLLNRSTKCEFQSTRKKNPHTQHSHISPVGPKSYTRACWLSLYYPPRRKPATFSHTYTARNRPHPCPQMYESKLYFYDTPHPPIAMQFSAVQRRPVVPDAALGACNHWQ